jgi:hypothetical protein
MNLVGKYLIGRKITGNITFANPDKGLGETRIYQSDIIELSGYNTVFIKNNGLNTVDVELQSSKVPIVVNAGGSVTIAGGSIDSIIDPILVEATSTVEDGTVTNLSHSSLEDKLDISIPADSTLQVLAADGAASRRSVSIQNISVTETLCRVGGIDAAAGRGAIIKGSIDAIASWDGETLGIVKIHNETGTAAKIIISWGVR